MTNVFNITIGYFVTKVSKILKHYSIFFSADFLTRIPNSSRSDLYIILVPLAEDIADRPWDYTADATE